MASLIKSLIEIFNPGSETNMATSGLTGGFAGMIILIVIAIFVIPIFHP